MAKSKNNKNKNAQVSKNQKSAKTQVAKGNKKK